MRRRVGLIAISLWALMAAGSLWILAGGQQEERVWVIRGDQSRQCAPRSGVRIEKSRAELEASGVRVLESEILSETHPRAQACGLPTGRKHRFLIWAADLEAAKKLGFSKQ